MILPLPTPFSRPCPRPSKLPLPATPSLITFFFFFKSSQDFLYFPLSQQFRLKSDIPLEPVKVPAGNNWQNLAKSTPSPHRLLPSARERTPPHLARVRKYLSVDPARMALPELLMPQFQTGRVYGADNEVEKGGAKEQNPNTCSETNSYTELSIQVQFTYYSYCSDACITSQ